MELLTLNTAAEFRNFDEMARNSDLIELHTYMGGLRSVIDFDSDLWYWMDSGEQIKTIKWHPGEPNLDLKVHICTNFFNDHVIENGTLDNISCRSRVLLYKFICQTTEHLCLPQQLSEL